MPFPANAVEMEAAGYIYTDTKNCKGCCAEIEWWITPTGAKLCMNPMPELDTKAVSHWATCPEAKSFRKKK